MGPQVLLDKLKKQLEVNGGEGDRSANMEEARSSHLVEAECSFFFQMSREDADDMPHSRRTKPQRVA